MKILATDWFMEMLELEKLFHSGGMVSENHSVNTATGPGLS